mgnify:CR=1 FL=1
MISNECTICSESWQNATTNSILQSLTFGFLGYYRLLYMENCKLLGRHAQVVAFEWCFFLILKKKIFGKKKQVHNLEAPKWEGPVLTCVLCGSICMPFTMRIVCDSSLVSELLENSCIPFPWYSWIAQKILAISAYVVFMTKFPPERLLLC